MNGRACSFACECGTHVYSTRTGPGHGAAYSLPDGVYGSAASSGWCVVRGLEAGGRGRGDVRSRAPVCVRREAVRRPAAPAGLVGGAGPRRCGTVCCHLAIDWYASLPPRACWSLSSCMARFFEAAAAGVRVAPILCANLSAVSLGWFWAMARSYPMTRSAATSCSPSSWRDLDVRRSHWSRVIWTSRPIAIGVASGICAERSSCRVRFTSCVHLLRTARELGGHINGRACSFVRAGAVRMCAVLVRGLGMGCVLPTGQGVRPELMLELVCYISRVYVPCGVRLG